MNYEQLTKSLRELKLQQHETEKLKGTQQNQIESLRKQKDSLIENMQKELQDSEGTARKEHEKKATAQIEKNLEMLNDKSSELRKKYEETLSRITFDKYKMRYKEDVQLSEQVKEILEKVKVTLDDLVGERFKKELYSQLSTATVDMDYDSIEQASERINKLHKNLDILNQGKGLNITLKVDSLLKKLSPCKDEKDEDAIRNGVIMYLAICIFTTVVVLNFLSPVLLLLLVVIGGTNIYKGYMAYRIVLETKILEDNKSLIDDLINKHVTEDMDKAKQMLKKKYEVNEGKIQARIDTTTDKLQTVLSKVKDNFEFDDSSIKAKYERTRSNLDHQINDLKDLTSKTDLKIAEIGGKINKLEAELMKSVEGMISYYINDESGKEFILSNKYLMDIVDKKPVFWEFPDKSCLFLYDEEEDVKAFTDLFIVQTMNRLHSSAFALEVWDPTNLGTDYIAYTKLPSRNFRLSVSKEELKTSQDELTEQLMLRRGKILESFDDIKDFNEEMIATDSLPASYTFLVLRSIDDTTMTKEELLNIIYNGPKVGVYTLMFLPKNTFADLGDKGADLMKKFHRFYGLSEGKVESRSRKVYERYFIKD